jgi:hypothetical protein
MEPETDEQSLAELLSHWGALLMDDANRRLSWPTPDSGAVPSPWELFPLKNL